MSPATLNRNQTANAGRRCHKGGPMNQRTFGSLLLAASLLATPAAAQTVPDTRAGEAARAREEKAAAPAVATGNTVERVLDFLENNALLRHLAYPPDGLSLRVGGIESGSGFAA